MLWCVDLCVIYFILPVFALPELRTSGEPSEPEHASVQLASGSINSELLEPWWFGEVNPWFLLKLVGKPPSNRQTTNPSHRLRGSCLRVEFPPH